MGKLSKIILSCACTVFAIAIIGFCVWKITNTPSAASSQNNSMDITDSETDSIKITAPDGSEFIIVNPPVPKSWSVSPLMPPESWSCFTIWSAQWSSSCLVEMMLNRSRMNASRSTAIKINTTVLK